MKLIFCCFLLVATFLAVDSRATCEIHWSWDAGCDSIIPKIVRQINDWRGLGNCDGEKCGYTLKSNSSTKIEAVHETPEKHYKDDLTFTFKLDDKPCAVKGYSQSELWYAVLDYGTNYCNLHNLIIGAGLDKMKGYKENTSNDDCTQYSSADCDKY